MVFHFLNELFRDRFKNKLLAFSLHCKIKIMHIAVNQSMLSTILLFSMFKWLLFIFADGKTHILFICIEIYNESKKKKTISLLLDNIKAVEKKQRTKTRLQNFELKTLKVKIKIHIVYYIYKNLDVDDFLIIMISSRLIDEILMFLSLKNVVKS